MPEEKKSIKSIFGDFNSKISGALGADWGATGANILSGLGNSLGKENSQFSESQQAFQSTIRKGLSAIPVYGQAIAAATGIVDAIGSLTGTNLSNINKDSADRLGMGDAAGFNNAINHLPGVSMLVQGVGSIFGGGKSDNFTASRDALSMSDAYGATARDLTAAEDLAGKNYFGGWRSMANDRINTAKENNRILAEISRTNTQRKQSDYYQDLQNQNINRYAGQNYRGMVVGKQGLKLMSVEEAKRILALRKSETPEKLQNGGNIPATEEQSIIPEGKLHKELHHLDKVNPELAEDLTRKGIPVITVDESGDINQVAEVERSEWTWSKALTDKIEALLKEWKETQNEELLLECGYAVAEELNNNTVNYNIEEENNGKK